MIIEYFKVTNIACNETTCLKVAKFI